jgi:predicted chitinase
MECVQISLKTYRAIRTGSTINAPVYHIEFDEEACYGGGGDGTGGFAGSDDGTTYGGSGEGGTYEGGTPNENDSSNDNQEPVDNLGDDLTIPIVINKEDDCNTTPEKLAEIFPNSPLLIRETLSNYINNHAAKFGIDTKEELCHFLAQTGTETGGYVTLNATEDMNYTTSNRLIEVYPSKFSLTDPSKANPNNYLNNPTALANLVYCCQYGNQDESSGDGSLYKGRGIIQLTWKGNYDSYVDFLNSIDFGWSYSHPSNLENVVMHAIMSGMWYFKDRVLDKITIDENTTSNTVTKKINRYTDKSSKQLRENYFNKAIEVIDCL